MPSFQFLSPSISISHPWILIGLALFFFALLKIRRAYWSRRITQWAENQHLKLVRFRRGRFYEGPSAWMRSRNQHVFRVATQNVEGRERSCWIVFGTYWGFTWGSPLSKVVWDDEKV